MPDTLLSTKLIVPPARPAFVHRARLTAELDAGLYRKMTLISAPAGFGKTTLLTDWLKTTDIEIKSAWYSLDEVDNDPTIFLKYLIGALDKTRQNDKGFEKNVLSFLQSGQSTSMEMVITSIINEIAKTNNKFVLVLDDYHIISSQDVMDALSFLVEFIPPNLHLVISTREDPQISLSKLRARDQLTEIRALDLRFSPNEAEEFLNNVMGLDLTLNEIDTLASRTEGWIAGLQLAALSLQGQPDVENLIKSFAGSHRLVLDYLMEEVLKKQTNEIREFLLKTAILDRLMDSLCDAVTGLHNSQRILRTLELANMFIVPLDDIRRWYRYHHLFADVLYQRLKTRDDININDLHLRARDWYAQNGLEKEAIRHSIIAQDYATAAELINNISMLIVQNGEHRTAALWMDALPEEIQKSHPYLWALDVWALRMEGKYEAAEKKIAVAEEALDKLPHNHSGNIVTIRGLINSHKAFLAFVRGDLDETVAISRESLRQLPEDMLAIRTLTSLYLGIALRYQGYFRKALEIYKSTLNVGKQLTGSSIAVSCFLHLSDLYYDLGELQKSKEFAEQAIMFTVQHTGRSDLPFLGFAYICVGRVLREWGQLPEAMKIMQQGTNVCSQWNVADVVAEACNEKADLHFSLGEQEAAQEALQDAFQIYQEYSPWAAGLNKAHQAKIRLGFGEKDAAFDWLKETENSLSNPRDLSRDMEYLTKARVLISQEKLDESLDLLEMIVDVSKNTGKKRTLLEALILYAQAYNLAGDDRRANQVLFEALQIGESGGYIQIFVDEGSLVKKMLDTIKLRDKKLIQYVKKLLWAFAETRSGSQLTKPLVDPLSEREIEVLDLISIGLSNQEVADRLFLTLNTVKVHTRNIYSKLGVTNRIQAVEKARSFGILN